MATLRIQRQVAPGQAPGSFNAPVSEGAQIASRDLQQAGQAVQQAGQVASQIWTREQAALNEARVNDGLNRLQRYGMEQQAEYSQLLGGDAQRADEQGRPTTVVYGERFDQQIGTVAGDMELTPFQRQLFERQAGVLSTRFRAGAQEHEIRQTAVYQDQVYSSGVATEQEVIQATDNREEIAAAQDRIVLLTAAETDRQGMPTQARAMTIRDNIGKAHLAAIQATADEDPRGAQDRLDRYADQMLPSQIAAARNATAGGLATQDAETWAGNLTAGGLPIPAGGPGAAFQMPLPGVSLPTGGGSDYGPRTSFRTANGQRASSDHDGVDFAAPAGTSVRAAAGGRVSRVVSSDSGYGNMVEVDHGNGLTTFYAHLQDFNVSEGDTVAPGQTFGRVGSTGNSTGPHLHMGAKRDGRSINPAELFTEESRAGAASARAQGVRAPSRAEADRMATERFGTNPIQLAAARSAIARIYSSRDAEERQGYEDAANEAYQFIEQNRRMPPASVLSRLKPGSLNSMTSYVETINAPATVHSDPTLELALAADSSWLDMSDDEFIGAYGSRLSATDRVQYVSQLTRARTAAGKQVQKDRTSAGVVPAEAFNRALNDTLDLRGVARGNLPQEERQQRAQLVQSMRVAVLQAQQDKGSQLTEGEMRTLVGQRVAALGWERPRGLFSAAAEGYQTSYRTMTPANQRTFRDRLTARGESNPSEAAIYEAYLLDRVNGVR